VHRVTRSVCPIAGVFMGCAVAVYILYSLPSIVTANRIAYVCPAGTASRDMQLCTKQCLRHAWQMHVELSPALQLMVAVAGGGGSIGRWSTPGWLHQGALHCCAGG
jgi:hypothetical protein